MNEETPYNPPGLDEYIREGARKNSALLRKMQGQPEPSATAEAKPDCAPRTGSAAWLKPGNIVRKHGCNNMRILALEGRRALVEAADGQSKKESWYEDINELLPPNAPLQASGADDSRKTK